MSPSETFETEHECTINAQARAVFALIVDVGDWPQIFPPTVHVQVLEQTGDRELLQIWATANGDVKTWVSRRDLDRIGHRVTFQQQVSQPPVARMSGQWLVDPLPGGRCRVRLTHSFQAVDSSEEKVRWIEQAVDRNSGAELAALAAAAEQPERSGELFLRFDDVVAVRSSPEQIRDFIYDAARWEERIPHVSRVILTEGANSVQTLEMDTTTGDGATHTTRSVRVGISPDEIVYKQLQPPALMSVHTGRWHFRTDGDGGTVTSTHTVVLDPAAVTAVLGAGKTIADARSFVRAALGRNSTTTIRVADRFAARRPVTSDPSDRTIRS